MQNISLLARCPHLIPSNVYVYYADFVGECVVALMTVAHYVHIWNVNGVLTCN